MRRFWMSSEIDFLYTIPQQWHQWCQSFTCTHLFQRTYTTFWRVLCPLLKEELRSRLQNNLDRDTLNASKCFFKTLTFFVFLAVLDHWEKLYIAFWLAWKNSGMIRTETNAALEYFIILLSIVLPVFKLANCGSKICGFTRWKSLFIQSIVPFEKHFCRFWTARATLLELSELDQQLENFCEI